MVSKTGIMKPRATIIKHRGGFFVVKNGNLNDRYNVINVNSEGKFTPGLETVKQYHKKINKKNGAGYTSVTYDPYAIVTRYDLTNDNDIVLDDIWDPNTYLVDCKTGLIIKQDIELLAFSITEDDTNKLETETIINKSETMETKTETVVVEETVNDNNATLNAQIEAEVEAKAQAQAEYIKQQTEKTGQTKTNNNNLNSNKMKTENQNASASNDANNNVQPVKSFGRQSRRGLAKITETAVVLTTDLAIGGLLFGSELLYITAEGLAWGQAAAVKPLGLHPDATRAELQKAAMARGEKRAEFAIALPLVAVKLPIHAYNVAKQATRKTSDNIEDAEIINNPQTV